MKKFYLISILILALVMPLFAQGTKEQAKEEKVVNLYSHRHYDVDDELYDAFYKKTGIKVNVVKAKAGQLIEKMKSEGDASPVDIFMTADAGNLEIAKQEGLLQSISSKELNKVIPEHLRDPEGQWYALTKRARVIAYAIDRVHPNMLSTYEDLSSPIWKRLIAVRSSSNMYNQSLLASIIANDGKEKAKEWAEGVVANMARAPKGNDRDQVKAVAAGTADLAIINTYYLGKLLTSKDNEEVKAGKAVKLFFPNQDGRGTHINISGAGVTKYAPHKENAIKLLEFLVSKEAQEVFAAKNFEYPVRTDVEPSELVKSFGNFKEDKLNLSNLGKYNRDAVMIFDQVGWK